MHTRNAIVIAVVVGLFVFFGAYRIQAQNAPPPNAPPPNAPPAGQDRHRGFDPEQMRQRMMEHIKEALGAGDKEWGAIQPALEEVMNLSRDAGGGGMFSGRRGMRPEGHQAAADKMAQQSDAAKAAQELRTLLENKDATPDDIKAKTAALRAAREKAKKELATSKEALREMLTPRQEAVLVLMGILD